MDKLKTDKLKTEELKTEELKTEELKEESKKEIKKYTKKPKDLVQEYIATFTPEQKKVHDIAIRILESSYSVEKSIGFLEFKKASENR
jgi:hypothetical protein